MATRKELSRDFLALSYKDQLTAISQFKCIHLPPIWYTLFSLVNCCLTSKHTSSDSANISVLRIFYGIVFNRHYDYAMLIWTDLGEVVMDNHHGRARNFVPFQRFLQLIIRSMMTIERDIPQCEGTPLGPHFVQHFLKVPNIHFDRQMPIPEALLAYADPDAPSVIAYMTEHGLVAPPAPEGPPQEPSREVHLEIGEGPRHVDEHVQVPGVLNRVSREKIR